MNKPSRKTHQSYVQHSTNPASKLIAKYLQNGPALEIGWLVKLRKMVENQYIKFCDQEEQIYFMATCIPR